MSFKKGTSGNPSGRPKGAKGVAKADILEKFLYIVNVCAERLQDDVQKLNTRDMLRTVVGLAPFIVPKQQSIDIQTQVTAEYDELRKLLDIMPDELVDRVASKIEQLHNLTPCPTIGENY